MSVSASRQSLGPVDGFAEGSCTIVEVDGTSIGIYRVDGAFYALRNLCPHQLAPLCRGPRGGTMVPSEPGTFVHGLDGWVVRCPRHGWEFDLRTGKTLFEIDQRKAKTYPVEVENDQVVIVLS
jgi:nitrite reductase (NADH) small subunit